MAAPNGGQGYGVEIHGMNVVGEKRVAVAVHEAAQEIPPVAAATGGEHHVRVEGAFISEPPLGEPEPCRLYHVPRRAG